MSQTAEDQTKTLSLENFLMESLSKEIAAEGFEVVHAELVNSRQKVLRIFIDRSNSSDGISLDDCATVSKLLDQPLEKLVELDRYFGGPYELEVSSPGLERPLHRETDFVRFSGKEARIHVLRPLTADEIENRDYHVKNPKQKNYFGVLTGFKDGKVRLMVLPEGSAAGLAGHLGLKPAKPGQKISAKKIQKALEERDRLRENPPVEWSVAIPTGLISKAHLEPHFDAKEILGE
ncbi:MAG: hypothetical protein JNL01_04410 [Bdellovibrionales bacterium]|nr:hypothetical protein [Bdellovibrionales bacterium]